MLIRKSKATLKDLEDLAAGFISYKLTGVRISIKAVDVNESWVGMVRNDLTIYLNARHLINNDGKINYKLFLNTLVHEMTHILDGHILVPAEQRTNYFLAAAEHMAESAAVDLFGYDLGEEFDQFYIRNAPEYHKITAKKRGYDVSLEEVINYLKKKYPNLGQPTKVEVVIEKESNDENQKEKSYNGTQTSDNNQSSNQNPTQSSGGSAETSPQTKAKGNQGSINPGGGGSSSSDNKIENPVNNKIHPITTTMESLEGKLISFQELSNIGKQKWEELVRNLGIPREKISIIEVFKISERSMSVSKSGVGYEIDIPSNVKSWKITLKKKIVKLVQQRKTHKKFLTTPFIVRREEMDNDATLVAIDTSGSMGDLPFEAVKTIKKLRPEAKIVYFDTEIHENCKKGKIKMGGGTDINKALAYLLEKKKKSMEQILISDMLDFIKEELLYTYLRKGGILITTHPDYKGKNKNIIYVDLKKI